MCSKILWVVRNDFSGGKANGLVDQDYVEGLLLFGLIDCEFAVEERIAETSC
jgi:hypothetical protein